MRPDAAPAPTAAAGPDAGPAAAPAANPACARLTGSAARLKDPILDDRSNGLTAVDGPQAALRSAAAKAAASCVACGPIAFSVATPAGSGQPSRAGSNASQ
jgi:hypothetical protein